MNTTNQMMDSIISKHTTKSNILNEDAKYWLTPRPYILKSISKTNKPRKTNSAISRKISSNKKVLFGKKSTYIKNVWENHFVDHVQWQHKQYSKTPRQ
jgi:light-regulated signal transduction histidine kinase (bacteriophytochrome)